MCSEPGCGRPVDEPTRRGGRGLCGTCYARHRRNGTLPPLPSRVCSREGCDRETEARGLCAMHYQRLTKSGYLEQPLATGPDEARFWAKADRSGGPESCWPWISTSVSQRGYGHFWLNGTTHRAHRVAYELTHGPIPEGLMPDHLCHTRDTECPGGNDCLHRRCINPAHLELVTHAENVERMRLTPGLRAKRITAARMGAAARWDKRPTS